jgi:drug/metabolite transporter (DMT)-like permease
MLWLIITIVSYFFGALTHLFDKYLLKKTMFPNPAVLTFYVGFLGILGLVLAPWGFSMLPPLSLALDLLSGLLYVAAMLFFFYALSQAEVSRVASLVGGLTPIFILTLGSLMGQEILTSIQLIAFAIIVTGGFLISLEKTKSKKTITESTILIAIFSAFLFSVAHLLSKFIYAQQGFVNGFIWVRVGGVLAALMLLLIPEIREAIAFDFKRPKRDKASIFLAGQTCGALNFILFNYAFTLGPLALIAALQGLQYVFLFLIVILLSWKLPKVIKERITPNVLIQKSVSIALIAAGVGLLSSTF